MAVTGFQKLTVAAAVALCAALILPKVLLRREPPEETAPGRFPPMMHRHVTPEPRGQRSVGVRGHSEVKGTGGGGAGTGGPGGKSNLAAQIIPVYGFGILLYILYILFKITSKGSSKPPQSRFQSLRSENAKRKITDYELSQLQERLRETELVMENLVNKTLTNEDSSAAVSVDQEQSLLQQLTEITRAMKTNQLVQDFSHEREDWEHWEHNDFVEDSLWSQSLCSCHCSQKHEKETPLEDQQTSEKETPLEDQKTHEEETLLKDQQIHKEETRLEDQQRHKEETPLADQQTHKEEMPLADQQTQEGETPLKDNQTHEEETPLEDQQMTAAEEKNQNTTVKEEQMLLEDQQIDFTKAAEEERTHMEDQQQTAAAEDTTAAEEEKLKPEKKETFQKTINVRHRKRRRRGRRE